ncbi:MAG: phage tail tape-measure protein [Mesorhizobium sp.]|uniref:phage tail length tape measure family protein n=1 Tax=Mesorhizobium sp. TaxID=1871066 RepID=UPI0012064CAF|nr:phage tail length tape measure family protein [Mesorhizobium sp.]TIT36013.1 MAG: phage tail tape-measure protein [Mesorhizobium sp.]
MADIATIGFRAETSELVDAKAKLDALAPAAANVKRGSDMVNRSLAETGTAAQRAAAGLGRATGAATQAAAAAGTTRTAATQAAAGVTNLGNAADTASGKLMRMRNAANQNSASLGAMKANTANIAAQFQDIGVTAAAGMSPLNIALQQGTQLASVFAAMKPAEAVKALGAAFLSLVGVVSLVTLGAVAIIAALIQFVNWAKLAKSALNEFADILPTIAPYVAAIGAVMLVTFGPAILGMITAVSEAVLGLTAQLVGLAIGFATANPAVAFIAGFALVLAALNIFRNEIAKALGVDLVGVVKDTVNYIIGGFVGAFSAIVATWRQLPAAFADLAVQAGNALISGIETAVNKSIQAMRSLWNYIADHDPTGMMPHNNDKSSVELGRIDNPNAGAAAGVADDIGKIVKDAQGQDYLGAAYKFVGDMASGAADKIKKLAGMIGVADAASAKKSHGKTEAEKFSDIVTGADNAIAKLQAEKDALFMTAEGAAELKYQTQLLNEARKKGIDLTPTQREQLMGLAHDMAVLDISIQNTKAALGFAKDVTKGFFEDFAQGIENGESLWQSFGDAALNVLNKVIDKLLNDLVDALFQVSSAGGGGGFWSALGSLFGGGSGGGGLGNLFGLGFMDSLAVGGVVTNKGLSSFAKGGDFTNKIASGSTMFSFAQGTALGEMGEAGPEAVMPLKRMGNGDLGVSATVPANQNGGSSGGPRAPLEVNVNVSGANGDKQIKEMVRQGVDEGIRQYDTYALPARVNEIGSDPRRR